MLHAVLHSSMAHGLLDGMMCEVRFTSRASRRQVVVPVPYTRSGDDVLVRLPHRSRNGWWRDFAHPHAVQVFLHGQWYQGLGRTVAFNQREWRAAVSAHRRRFPSVHVDDADAFVVISLRPTAGYASVPADLTSLHTAPN
jgi:hypothetical protein